MNIFRVNINLLMYFVVNFMIIMVILVFFMVISVNRRLFRYFGSYSGISVIPVILVSRRTAPYAPFTPISSLEVAKLREIQYTHCEKYDHSWVGFKGILSHRVLRKLLSDVFNSEVNFHLNTIIRNCYFASFSMMCILMTFLSV